MGSPLGPTLADILMTAFEDEIVRPLLSSNLIKFYSRYVDDTFVLIKPCDHDIPNVPKKFNSFHPLITFTHEEFTDNNDVHFLDIKITSFENENQWKSASSNGPPLMYISIWLFKIPYSDWLTSGP